MNPITRLDDERFNLAWDATPLNVHILYKSLRLALSKTSNMEDIAADLMTGYKIPRACQGHIVEACDIGCARLAIRAEAGRREERDG